MVEICIVGEPSARPSIGGEYDIMACALEAAAQPATPAE
jgi:hypothetical protein